MSPRQARHIEIRHTDVWRTLERLRPPRVTRALAWLLAGALILLVTLLATLPWVQTAEGQGRVTALDPRDRLQDINALVSGRVDRWYVRDGSEVSAGDPIIRLEDNDPRIVERLESERAAIERKVAAAESAVATAQLNLDRQERLHADGLSSRLELETARIRMEELNGALAAARAELTQIEVRLSRQSAQVVRAPRDGTIVSVAAGGESTFINAGDRIATFLPHAVTRAVELFIDGRDAALIEPGRKVRLQFEGWPAVQFSGWPSLAVGTFPGEVAVVDRSAVAGGRFRVLVTEDSEAEPWPEERFIRFGTQARGWVLLDTVKLGYELWRRLNNFPPEFSRPVAGGGNAGPGAGQEQTDGN